MTDPVEVEAVEPEENPYAKVELNMVIYPQKSLKAKGTEVSEETAKDPFFRQCVGSMIRNMYQYAGIGIAAQQVGIPKAVFILDTEWSAHGHKKPQVFLNPVIEEYDGGTIALNPPGEGCLSTPYGYRAQVGRSEKIRISWHDFNTYERHDEWFEGVESIAIQHEIDHLHGLLFVDRLSRLKQDIFKRKARKQRRHYERGVKKVRQEMTQMMLEKGRMNKAKQRAQERLDAIAARESKKEWSNG